MICFIIHQSAIQVERQMFPESSNDLRYSSSHTNDRFVVKYRKKNEKRTFGSSSGIRAFQPDHGGVPAKELAKPEKNSSQIRVDLKTRKCEMRAIRNLPKPSWEVSFERA